MRRTGGMVDPAHFKLKRQDRHSKRIDETLLWLEQMPNSSRHVAREKKNSNTLYEYFATNVDSFNARLHEAIDGPVTDDTPEEPIPPEPDPPDDTTESRSPLLAQ